MQHLYKPRHPVDWHVAYAFFLYTHQASPAVILSFVIAQPLLAQRATPHTSDFLCNTGCDKTFPNEGHKRVNMTYIVPDQLGRYRAKMVLATYKGKIFAYALLAES